MALVAASSCHKECDETITCNTDGCVEWSTSSAVELDCSGTDPENFCDDCNPCTADANCTSCDTIPPPHTIYNCTPDEKLPTFCNGVPYGCWHKVLTDSVDNSCFPVQGSGMTDDLHPGRCCVGVCSENGRACPGAMLTAN